MKKFNVLILLSTVCYGVISSTSTQDRVLMDLYKRAEEYQPEISNDFPHLLNSQRLEAWADMSIDPCDDFYEYSCGGFKKRYVHYEKADVLELMQQSNAILMEQILTQPEGHILATSKIETDLYDKVSNYYKSCVDTNTIQSRGFSPIIPYAKRIVEACHTAESFPDLMGSVLNEAVWAFLRVQYSKVDGVDPDNLRLQFYPPAAFEVNSDQVMDFLAPFVEHKVIELRNGYTLEKVADWVSRLESKMQQFVRSINFSMKDGKAEDQFITVAELSAITDMDWSVFVEKLGLQGADNIFLYGSAKLWIESMKQWESIDPHDLQWYLLYRMGVMHFNKLSQEYYDIYGGLDKGMRAPIDDPHDKMEKFQQECVEELGVHLNYLAGHIYTKYAFNDTQKASASEMIQGLYSSFEHELQRLEWMDDETRQAALNKLHNIIFIVGYPDWMKDSEAVAKYYESVDFGKELYFENAVAAQYHAEFAISTSQINKPWKRDELYFGFPWQLNAFHLTDYVQVQINTGILQRPLFSHDNRLSMNYGSLGMIIGHEVSHAFDSIGKKINDRGVEVNWWSDQTEGHFEDSTHCFVNQYSAYQVHLMNPLKHPLKVDGQLTLSENIADNGGLHVAYQAWKAAVGNKVNIADPMPDFGGLTDEQVFFVSFAQTWCSIVDDKKVESLVKRDPHSPNPVRVRGVVSNSPDFARAFKCGTHSPNEKCALY